jgi:hypothetical protein
MIRISADHSQDRGSKSLVDFRRNLDDILSVEYSDSSAKAVAIRQWERRQQSQDEAMWSMPVKVDHEDPHRLL